MGCAPVEIIGREDRFSSNYRNSMRLYRIKSVQLNWQSGSVREVAVSELDSWFIKGKCKIMN